MNLIVLELQNHIESGAKLLSSVPAKSQYLQQERAILGKHSTSDLKNPFQSSVSSAAKQQVEFLRNDYSQKKKRISKEYDNWFSGSALSLSMIQEENILKNFESTKEQLDLYDKLNSGIKVLENALSFLKENKEKQDEIQIKQAEQVDLKKDSWKKLIDSGESDSVEFKSSLRWDFKGDNLNKSLEVPVIKSVAAFLNSKGGTLFIGIDDEKQIIGLEADYPTLKRKDGDGFIQYMLQILNHSLGKEFNRFISMHIAEFSGKEICVVEVSKSDKPVFMKHNNKEEFYIRASLSSQPLNVRETVEYVKMHFKDYVKG